MSKEEGNIPAIRLSNVKKRFSDKNYVLKGIDLDVYKGDVVAIIGPSGAGKSTMLRCMNRLESIDSGTIEIEGRDRKSVV